jgi:methylenetetrahydrofolate dehydrogenase (NADP+)/methenyltetrahydrofolate cyclohydrolase
LRTASADTAVDGILLQLPLPSHLDTNQVVAAIAQQKDVDGFHPHSQVVSPLIQAIEASLDAAGCTSGTILLLGRQSIFTRALQTRLRDAGFVVSCASGATTIPASSKRSDIIISVRGRGPKILPKHLKKGAVVIDGGIRRYEQKISGDADPSIASVASAYTPVPGGIGPMTVAYAIANTLLLAKKKELRDVTSRR